MEWKQEQIPKTELEKKQNDYMKMAMDMAKRSTASPEVSHKKAYEGGSPPAHIPPAETHAEVVQTPPEVVQTPPEVTETPQVVQTPHAEMTVPPHKKAFEIPHKKVFEQKHEKHEKPEKTEKHETPPVVEKAVEEVPRVLGVQEVHKEEKPKVIEKVVEKVEKVEKVIKTPEININKSKTIEINADVNINAGALFVKPEPEQKPQPVEVIEEVQPEPPRRVEVVGIEEVRGEVLGETEVVGTVCAEENISEQPTNAPFENFKTCECDKLRENRCDNGSQNSAPPNFNNFINQHNARSCGCNNSGNSWKNFKKN